VKLNTKILLFCISLSFFGCLKKEVYPPEPYLEYRGFYTIPDANGIDQSGQLSLYFTDGDGDFGLNESDTLPPYDKEGGYYYNLIIDYFEIQNGVPVAFSFPDIPFSSRIKPLVPLGRDKTLKGVIDVKIEAINNPFSSFDTIIFEAKIVDRALNVSNTVSTPPIKIKKQ